MTVPKPDKRKHTARTWLDRLFGARHIDFVAPVSLETSAKAVKAKMNRSTGNWFEGPTRTKVVLTQLDIDTFELRLSRRYMRGFLISASGYLKRWETRKTYVSVRVKPFYEIIIAFVAVFIICLLSPLGRSDFSLISGWILVCLGPGFALGFIVAWAFSYITASELQRELEATLGAGYESNEQGKLVKGD